MQIDRGTGMKDYGSSIYEGHNTGKSKGIDYNALRIDREKCFNYNVLRIDCEKCFGLCCVALFFSASEGFPKDKEAGSPCPNLQMDFRCSVHESLREKGLKGCSAFDCFGAGPKVSQVTFKGMDWRKASETANQMFEVFLVVRQLHEMLWYLTQAFSLVQSPQMQEAIASMLEETKQAALLSSDQLLQLDAAAHRGKVNPLLQQVSELVRSQYLSTNDRRTGLSKKLRPGADLVAADLRSKNLRGANLRGSWLIAADLRGVDLSGADLIGADLRNTDLRGADLSDSIFLTQAQLNVAKGDRTTKIPGFLLSPDHWER
ncbi:pentapeptide repeat-containing protein [Sinanaerobacter chloroacetimidivorans]|nr:pentapeptide repeat-containing protein [Sinanaerobacter chloroacetimidivorans]